MHSQSSTHNSKDDKDSCCDEEVDLFEGQDELQLSVLDFSLDIPIQFTVFSIVYIFQEFYTAQSQPTYTIYHPPEYRQNVQTLFQVFLI